MTSPGPAAPLASPASASFRNFRPFKPEESLSEAQKAERQVKSILNKLTREKFDTLYAQTYECFVKSEDKAEITSVIAREVFAKATMQACFVEMYAEFCCRLHTDLNKAGIEVPFKRALLDRCQQSFNVHLEPPRIDECLDYEEQYEELVKYKTRMTGTVRLIGHLLRQRMLSPKVIFCCTDELIEIGSPEALETLCAFLETIGSLFDNPEWQGHARLEEVFTRVRNFAEDKERPQRSRCLLKDLLDKRQSKWKERVVKEPEKPEESLWRSNSYTDNGRASQDSDWRSAKGSRTPTMTGVDEATRRSRTNSEAAGGQSEEIRRSNTFPGTAADGDGARRREAPPRSPAMGWQSTGSRTPLQSAGSRSPPQGRSMAPAGAVMSAARGSPSCSPGKISAVH